MLKKVRNKGSVGILLATFASLTGCASSPLAKLVKDDAPAFVQKRPAQADAELGRRLNGDQVETNACFKGVLAPSLFQGWSNRTLEYSDAINGKLSADFGSTLSVSGDASADWKGFVSLKNIKQAKLEKLYFDPAGACASDDRFRAEYLSEEGREELVLTKALMAESIEINEITSSKSQVALNTSVVGGQLLGRTPAEISEGSSSASRSEWKGSQLYFAHSAEKVRVTLRESSPCVSSIGKGQACDLQPCSISVQSLTAKGEWSAQLTCQDGFKTALKEKLGNWTGAPTGNGVSYGVRVTGSEQVGVIRVELKKWNTLGLNNG